MDPPKSMMRERRTMVEADRFLCGCLRTVHFSVACAIPAIEDIRSQPGGEQTQQARIVRICLEASLRMLARFEGFFRRWKASACSHCSHPFIQRVVIRCQRADLVSYASPCHL